MVNEFGRRSDRSDESASRAEPAEKSETSAETAIDPRLDSLIGRSLQAHYADIVASPLPDTILVLLAQLEAKEKSA